MALSSTTFKLIKNLIHGDAVSDSQLIELRSDIAHALNSGKPAARPRQHHPSRTPSGNMAGRASAKQNVAEDTLDFLGDWATSSAPVGQDIQDSIDYEPTPSEYFDDDFENARKNRKHIDDVMKRMF